jgi:hypothetical protein
MTFINLQYQVEYTATRIIQASSRDEHELLTRRSPAEWEMPNKSCFIHMFFVVGVKEPTNISWTWEVRTTSSNLD